MTGIGEWKGREKGKKGGAGKAEGVGRLAIIGVGILTMHWCLVVWLNSSVECVKMSCF